MRRLSRTDLNSLMPPGQALYLRHSLVASVIVNAFLVLFLLFLLFFSTMALFSSYAYFFFINLMTLPVAFYLASYYQDPRKPLLVIGPAGLFTATILDLGSYVTYRDTLVAWDELRGLILADEADGSGPQLRLYTERPDHARRLVEHRVDLSPLLYGRGYAAARPIIDAICSHAGFTFLLRRQGQPDLTAPPATRVRPPWKIIFKAPPGAKRTWQF